MWIVITLIFVAAAATALEYAPPLWMRRRQTRRIRRESRGKLALTYDDGPDETLTPALIDLLARYQARATFFLVGFRAEANPEVCDRLAADRHEIGSHTHWHQSLWGQWPWKAARQIEQGYRTLSRWTPSDAPFRPPWGRLTTWSWLALRRRGRRAVWWTRAAGDTFTPLCDAEAIRRGVREDGGGVLLMHCWHPSQEQRDFVLDLTRRLLDEACESGMEICTVSQLLERGSNGRVCGEGGDDD